ncbi:hypothetical protein IVB30_02110 [Bradyrhizobium sp. 200]|nr:hypothetical protein IVB30_02110 [Bradyrhizobium sp. 200]
MEAKGETMTDKKPSRLAQALAKYSPEELDARYRLPIEGAAPKPARRRVIRPVKAAAPMKSRKARIAAALAIKAAAMRVIESEGEHMKAGPQIPIVSARSKGLNIVYTPNVPAPGPRMVAWQAANGIAPPPPLTDLLDVWPVGSNKVFSMRWNAAGLVEVGTFKRGEWEATLTG